MAVTLSSVRFGFIPTGILGHSASHDRIIGRFARHPEALIYNPYPGVQRERDGAESIKTKSPKIETNARALGADAAAAAADTDQLERRSPLVDN